MVVGFNYDYFKRKEDIISATSKEILVKNRIKTFHMYIHVTTGGERRQCINHMLRILRQFWKIKVDIFIIKHL